MKLIAKTYSENLWWGIYGLTNKIGWEDVMVFYEDGRKIGKFCLNTKQYLRFGLEDLRTNPTETDFVEAIESYLNDNQFHYWYYYNEIGDEDIYEIPYKDVPLSSEGLKPRFFDIWHPDENIGISTIKSAVREFARKFLEFNDCEVEIGNIINYEESVKSLKEHEELFGGENPVKIEFSSELITDLSNLWNQSEDEVLSTLEKNINKK